MDIKVRLTTVCKQACGFCYVRTTAPRTMLWELLSSIVSASNWRTGTLRMTGGEPLLYRDLKRATCLAVECGHTPIISTSATAGPTSLWDALVRNHVLLKVSLHSPSPETHDATVGRSGSFHRVEQRLAWLTRHGAANRLIVQCVVGSENFRELPQLARVIAAIGVRRMFLLPESGWRNPSTSPMSCSVEERRLVAGELAALRAQVGIRVSNTRILTVDDPRGSERHLDCGALTRRMSIDVDGRIYPCTRLRGRAEYAVWSIPDQGLPGGTDFASIHEMQHVVDPRTNMTCATCFQRLHAKC